MLTLVGLTAGLLLLASLPYWLPASVLALRVKIFTRINGEEGMEIPGKLVDAARFKQVYSHPAANGRSRGAALSDLFWYWLSPGPEIHQEHVEPGERYEEIARSTRRILSLPKKAAEELTASCVARVLHRPAIQNATWVRLRDLIMPVWAEFYYQLVFGERCPAVALELIVGNANDVATALKCCGLRHMEKRHRLTRFLIEKVQAGDVRHELPPSLSTEERALYLQGAFFNTAVVQMSEAMVHLLMVLAEHQDVQARVANNLEDDRYLRNVIDQGTTIPKGTVVCFNHPQYHRLGFDRPDAFDPERWEKISGHEMNYIPFGVAANRACPAQGLAPVTMRAAAHEILRHFVLYSSAAHTRSIPNRGPCLLAPRPGGDDPRRRRAMLILMRLRDRWEDVWRSIAQLVLGTYMVWDARQQRLCERYFETAPSVDQAANPTAARSCPIHLHLPSRARKEVKESA
jgi:hypothetical protein